FTIVSTTRGQSPLAVPKIVSVDNGNAGELVIKAKSIRNAKAYEVRKATVPANAAQGAWELLGSFPRARAIVIGSLTAGTTYAFCVRAVGGSTNRSDWSDPVTHMAM